MDTPSDSENKRSKFELRAILESSRLLIESHDSNFIMQNVLLNLMGKLMISKSAIFLFDEQRKDFFAIQTKGLLHFEVGQRLTWNMDAYFNEKPVYILNEFDENYPEVFWKNDLKTLVHIKTNQQYLGFILLGSKLNRKELDQQEIDFIASLAIILSVAITNSQLFTDLNNANRNLDRRIQELHTLFDLSKEFSATVDREQILKIFKFALLGQMFVRSFFLVFDRDGKRTVISKNGLPAQFNDESLLVSYDKINEPIRMNIFGSCPIAELSELNFQLLLPLRLQDKKQAVLGIGNRLNNEAFTEADINFLYSLGNLVLMSVQKTYLLEEQIEKERIEKELTIARSIQKRLLPSVLPPITGYQLDALNEPSQFVGGDYYDVIPADEYRSVIAIADVTGKGVPASLIMANLQAMLHLYNDSDVDLPSKTGKINDIIYQNTPVDIFITFFWGILNSQKNTFTYVNAGHNATLHYRAASKEIVPLDKGGLLIGALKTFTPYQSDTVPIEKGDILVFYTDGVTEAMDAFDEEFEEERLLELIRENHHLNAQDLKNCIVSRVKQFANNRLNDDLTLIVIKRDV